LFLSLSLFFQSSRFLFFLLFFLSRFLLPPTFLSFFFDLYVLVAFCISFFYNF
jgi:hypothetical protein